MFRLYADCFVIGYAGTDDKVDWLVNELGFDRAFNYKKVDMAQSLQEAAPNGVDCYFDNVHKLIIDYDNVILMVDIGQLLGWWHAEYGCSQSHEPLRQDRTVRSRFHVQ